MNIDYQFITEKLSTVIWHSALLVSVVGVLKLFLTQYFLYKITLSKKSEIKVFKDGKSASFSNYEDVPEKVINIYKNAEEINPDYFDKAE
jgi:hypothetical protein